MGSSSSPTARISPSRLQVRTPAAVASAPNRQNQPSFHPLPTFSAGAVLHLPGSFDGARALSAALAEPKRVAKGRAGGSRFFVDRRTPQRTLLAA